MDKEKKYLVVVFLIGLIGVCNLAAGILVSLYLDELNLPMRISVINSKIGALDPNLIKTIDLQTSISNIREMIMKELTSFMSYSQMLNALPLYLILNGILFIILSGTLYFLVLEENNPHKSDK